MCACACEAAFVHTHKCVEFFHKKTFPTNGTAVHQMIYLTLSTLVSLNQNSGKNLPSMENKRLFGIESFYMLNAFCLPSQFHQRHVLENRENDHYYGCEYPKNDIMVHWHSHTQIHTHFLSIMPFSSIIFFGSVTISGTSKSYAQQHMQQQQHTHTTKYYKWFNFK